MDALFGISEAEGTVKAFIFQCGETVKASILTAEVTGEDDNGVAILSDGNSVFQLALKEGVSMVDTVAKLQGAKHLKGRHYKEFASYDAKKKGLRLLGVIFAAKVSQADKKDDKKEGKKP